MNIDWFTFAAQIFNFVILVFLLQRFLYRPVLKVMDEREKGIAGRIEDARRKDEEAQQKIREFTGKVREIDAQRARMMEQARLAAEAQGQALSEKARSEVADEKSRWYASLQQEKDAVLRRLRERLGAEVFAVARKSLQDIADVPLEEQVLRRFLENFRENGELLKEVRGEHGLVRVTSAFDIPLDTQRRIIEALRPLIPIEGGIQFETSPAQICGIELSIGGKKFSWNVAGYLDAMEQGLKEYIDRTAVPSAGQGGKAHAGA